MRSSFLSTLLLALSVAASAALAHHPGEDLDAMLMGEEAFFQPIDEPAPPFDLVDADGDPVRLSDFADRIVVLDFVFASCTDVCPLQSAVLAEVQAKVNASPMKDRVQFITVTTDPRADTPEVLRRYGEAHGLDPANWMFLTTRPGDPEDATRGLSQAYDNSFTPVDGGQQMHGAVFHVIDRGGRLAARFHGLRFDPLNMVLYLNGLANMEQDAGTGGWWEGVTGLFR